MNKTLFALPLIAPALLDGCTGSSRNAHDDGLPNVIIIYADDLGFGDLPLYGGLHTATPNVERLARQGTRFTNVHATASTSTPSRYALLTGEYAWRRPGTDVAAGDAGMIIRPEQFTMADMFRSRGYATAAIGKWHLGLGDRSGEQDWNAPLAAAPGDLGFDYSFIMAATADRVPCVFIENGAVVSHDPQAPIEVSYSRNFEGEPTGRDNPELLYNLRPSHGHDMSIVNGISRIGYMKGGGRALWKDEYIADSIAQHAVDFIGRNSDRPFFLYVATNDIHVPRFPHERFRGRSPMGLRGDAILSFDWTVGQVLDAVERAGIADRTLIILSSDNGPAVDDGYDDRAEELLGGHSPTGYLRGGKYSAFEGGTMVPAVVWWPSRVAGGEVSDVLMSQIDWMRSLGSLIGAVLPRDAAPDSFDRLGNLLGEDAADRPWVLEQAADHTLSVCSREWKYIEPSDGAPMVTWGPKIETGYAPAPQLYGMAGRDETVNLAAENPDVTARFERLLYRIRANDYADTLE